MIGLLYAVADRASAVGEFFGVNVWAVYVVGFLTNAAFLATIVMLVRRERAYLVGVESNVRLRPDHPAKWHRRARQHTYRTFAQRLDLDVDPTLDEIEYRPERELQ